MSHVFNYGAADAPAVENVHVLPCEFFLRVFSCDSLGDRGVPGRSQRVFSPLLCFLSKHWVWCARYLWRRVGGVQDRLVVWRRDSASFLSAFVGKVVVP